ncbi:MAG: tetratricopeptide repeat protein [Xanthomonadaceae bacterium]|nr:tetratricopeptide repeat protein [Xanthomonadaceae bacterium]MBU6477038.1 tetratricopeptide repeat protein [Xanthomonadaceae bacterium]MDE2053311.1 tetratricopeptide repeat protein [Xanthomonadaceae bacterium]MDE2225125.1 tetratricopeptide repeat protein [Xanthomonadaceae bacterium]MDE2496297.1 tetratricopeptide repeat protein [Xanthomonadaceae bacterium]
MAFEDYDEYEQGEQVRKWIKENGIAVATGVVLAFALIFGWRQWQAHTANTEIQAASQFAVVQNAVQSGNKQAMGAALGDLQKNYAKSPYAAFASAAVAEYDVGKNDLKQAVQNLQWAEANSRQPALQALFSLRLARVLLADGKPQDALASLGKVPSGDYAAMAAELRGDAQLKLGKADAARADYQDALARLDKDAPGRSAVQTKLDNLTQPSAASTGKQGQ